MTHNRLQEIIAADGRVTIQVDRYGGQFVLNRTACIHGHLAIIHRRELLAEVHRLHHLRQLEDQP